MPPRVGKPRINPMHHSQQEVTMSTNNTRPINHETVSSEYRYAVVKVLRCVPDFSKGYAGGTTYLLIALTEWSSTAIDLVRLLANSHRGEEFAYLDAKGGISCCLRVEPEPEPVDGWTTADTSSTSLEAEIAAALEPEPFDGVPADTKKGSQIN
jgi:hypothetical protein